MNDCTGQRGPEHPRGGGRTDKHQQRKRERRHCRTGGPPYLRARLRQPELVCGLVDCFPFDQARRRQMAEDERTIAQQVYDARYSFRQLVHALDRPIAELDARAAPGHGEPVRDVFGNFVFRQRLELAAYHPSIERLELGPLQERQ